MGRSDTGETLTEVCAFLGSQVSWMIDAPDFGVEEFADHIRRAVSRLRRWDRDRDSLGYGVPCPSLTDAGECGYQLRYVDASERVTCRRCGATRSVSQLMAVVLATDTERAIWVDPEAAARHYGVTERELRRWASKGHVKRSHGRYLLSDITKEVSA